MMKRGIVYLVSKTFTWVFLISYKISNNNNTKYQYNNYFK